MTVTGTKSRGNPEQQNQSRTNRVNKLNKQAYYEEILKLVFGWGGQI